MTVRCKVYGCGWDTRGSAAGADPCPDMRSEGCLLSLACEDRFAEDEDGRLWDAALASYVASEPTPGRARVETWRRGSETTVVDVGEDGIVRASAEVLAVVLADAGWVRES